MTSGHPADVAEGYCGNCHDWTATDPIAPLTEPDLTELETWANRVATEASGWAERAQVSSGAGRAVMPQLDGLASVARYVASVLRAASS